MMIKAFVWLHQCSSELLQEHDPSPIFRHGRHCLCIAGSKTSQIIMIRNPRPTCRQVRVDGLDHGSGRNPEAVPKFFDRINKIYKIKNG